MREAGRREGGLMRVNRCKGGGAIERGRGRGIQERQRDKTWKAGMGGVVVGDGSGRGG